jgi:hypothetical protein
MELIFSPARQPGRARKEIVMKIKVTREYIESLRLGDLAPDPFGKLSKITKIYARREDINGKLFICYYTEFSPNSQISNSLKESI